MPAPLLRAGLVHSLLGRRPGARPPDRERPLGRTARRAASGGDDGCRGRAPRRRRGVARAPRRRAPRRALLRARRRRAGDRRARVGRALCSTSSPSASKCASGVSDPVGYDAFATGADQAQLARDRSGPRVTAFRRCRARRCAVGPRLARSPDGRRGRARPARTARSRAGHGAARDRARVARERLLARGHRSRARRAPAHRAGADRRSPSGLWTSIWVPSRPAPSSGPP